jgi:hypothetical protein
MTVLIASRKRGSFVWSHYFRVAPSSWRSFYRHARLWRDRLEYARVVGGEYEAVL